MALISDDDSIVGLRLSYDLPDSAVEITKQLALSTEMLATNLQVIARYSKDAKDYMAALPDIQRQMQQIQKDQVRVLEQTADAEERIAAARKMGGTTFPAPLTAPQQTTPSGSRSRSVTPREAAMNQASFESREMQRGMRVDSEQQRDNGVETPATQELARLNKIKKEDEAEKELDRRSVAENGGWTQQLGALKGNLGAGLGVLKARDLGGALRGGQNLLQGLGGAGGALAGAARAVPWVAGAAAVVEGAGMVNDQYQQYRQMGMTNGGGASQGIGYEMAIKSMALNPFIGTDQARQIVMGALNQGYTGKEFDTVTDFMATNLKDMNLQVADSVKLLQTNVNLGGQSIEGLNSQLATLSATSATSNTSQADMQKQFIAANAAATAAGMSGVASGDFSLIASNLFQNQGGKVNPLKGMGMSSIGTAAFSPQMEAMISSIRGKNEKPWQVPDIASSEGSDVYMNEVQSILQGYAAKGLDAHQFNTVLSSAFGMQLSDAQAGSLQKQLLQPGGITGPAEKALKVQTKVTKRGSGDKFGTQMSEGWSTTLQAGRSLYEDFISPFKGKLVGATDESIAAKKKLAELNTNAKTYGSGSFSSPALDQLENHYGLNNVYLNENGKRTKLSDLDYNDRKTFDRISSGQLVTSAKGGTPQDLSTFMNTGENTSSQAGLYTGSVTVGLTSEAVKALKIVSTTGIAYQGSYQALSAENAATFNGGTPGWQQ